MNASLHAGSGRSSSGVPDLDDAPVLVCLARHNALLPSLIPRPALVQLGAPAASLPSVLPRSLLPYSHSPPTFIHSSLLLPQCYSRLPHSPSPHSLSSLLTPPLYLPPTLPRSPHSLSPFCACRSLAPWVLQSVSALLRVSVYTQQHIILECVKSKAYLRNVLQIANRSDQTK